MSSKKYLTEQQINNPAKLTTTRVVEFRRVNFAGAFEERPCRGIDRSVP